MGAIGATAQKNPWRVAEGRFLPCCSMNILINLVKTALHSTGRFFIKMLTQLDDETTLFYYVQR